MMELGCAWVIWWKNDMANAATLTKSTMLVNTIGCKSAVTPSRQALEALVLGRGPRLDTRWISAKVGARVWAAQGWR